LKRVSFRKINYLCRISPISKEHLWRSNSSDQDKEQRKKIKQSKKRQRKKLPISNRYYHEYFPIVLKDEFLILESQKIKKLGNSN
jgi:hypothetical protein